MHLKAFSSYTLRYLYSLWLWLNYKCHYFQQQHPIFICSMYWLTGIVSRPYPECGAILLIFLHLFTSKTEAKYQILLGISFLISLFTYTNPNFNHVGPVSGKFFIKYKSKMKNTYLGDALLIQYPCGATYHHLPSCTIICNIPLETSKKYHLQGEVLNHTSQFIFKSNDWSCLIPSSKISLLHRYLRKSCENRLLQLFSSQDSGKFVSGLLLGTPLPIQLKKQFQNKGLAHVFAISGWHFSLLSSGLFILFSPFPTKIRSFLVLIILSLSTLFFPFSPSVWRSWFSLIFLCLSQYSSGICSSLNRLGACFILCSSMFSIYLPGFFLSFLATLGILLFFPHVFRFFYSPWSQIAPFYFKPILRYIYGSISLSISSQILLIFPMMKFFDSLPLEGLIYNLFFPLLLLPIFFLILSSIFLPFLSPITDFCIHQILSLPPLHAPNIFISLSFSSPSSLILTCLLLSFFLIGVCLEKTQTTTITYRS
nr:ComEC/Rec2 family competence protein [Chlamydia avium]